MRSFVCGAAAVAAALLSMPAPRAAAETGWNYIDSIPITDYMRAEQIERLIAGSELSEADRARAMTSRTAFTVEKPAGDGPFPAVFFLHGCGGVVDDHYRSWDHWFLARGYAFVMIDSWGPRRIIDVCDAKNRLAPAVRIGDVYATLFHLAEHRERYRIDPRRVVLAGFSNGGGVVIDSMRASVPLSLARRHKSTARLAAGFSFYPHCGKGNRPIFYNPVFIFIGEGDDWTPAAPCARWGKLPAAPGAAPLEVHVFPDAFHGFDYPAHVSATITDGGHIDEYNPIARAKSEKIMDAFLRTLDATLVAKQATAEKLRRALSGNTLRFQLQNGRTVFQYLAPDGRAPITVVGGRRFDTIRWRMDEHGNLCRTSVRAKRDVCLPVAMERQEVVIYRPNGKAGQKVALLTGDQRPKLPAGAGRMAARSPADGGAHPRRAGGRMAARNPGGGGMRQWGEGQAKSREPEGSSGFLSEAQLRAAVVGNTLAFRGPANGRDLLAYFAPDGTVEITLASGEGKTNRQRWYFKDGGQLCRPLPNGRDHCVRAEGEAGSVSLTFVARKVRYDVRVMRGKRFSRTGGPLGDGPPH